MTRILINTVLLEKNRWESGSPSSIHVSEWVEDFQRNGFNGMELWANHILQASENEVKKLLRSPLPIEIYNSYVRFEDEYAKERKVAAEMINKLDVQRVKFNFGSSPFLKERYIQNLLNWKSLLPEECELLCECHPGTIMEDPTAAKELFKRFKPEELGAIIHPFHVETDLELWFEYLGSAITHAHVSLFDSGTFYQLKRKPELVKERIHIMKEANFKGTLSLEFTEGTATKQETPELLYKNSLEDLAFLFDHF